MSELNLLFVCTGNVCRSPMAEALLRRALGPRSGWRISSAGTATVDGMPASDAAVEAVREAGLDMLSHRSRALTYAMVDSAYIIIVMTEAHKQTITRAFPVATDKVYLLKSFSASGGSLDIADPMGQTMDFYRGTRDEIDAALPGLIRFVEKNAGCV